MVAVVRLVKPEMVIVFEANAPATIPVTEPRFVEKLSAEDRNVTLLGPVDDRSQVKTNEVGVKVNPALGVTIN